MMVHLCCNLPLITVVPKYNENLMLNQNEWREQVQKAEEKFRKHTAETEGRIQELEARPHFLLSNETKGSLSVFLTECMPP